MPLAAPPFPSHPRRDGLLLQVERKKSTYPKAGALSLTHGEVFLAAPIRASAGEVLPNVGPETIS